ncbi:MAG: ADP-ribosylation factor-like protein, partial [Candidatus Hodarchaeales archaeon]
HIVMDSTVLGLIDVGGQKKFLDMRYHERFVRTADGLVFVVDSSQRNFRNDEEWLDEALRLIPKELPILIIANKQDLPIALSPEFIRKAFVDAHMKGRSYQLFGTVATDPGGIRSGENLFAAFDVLIHQMKRRRNLVEQAQFQ